MFKQKAEELWYKLITLMALMALNNEESRYCRVPPMIKISVSVFIRAINVILIVSLIVVKFIVLLWENRFLNRRC